MHLVGSYQYRVKMHGTMNIKKTQVLCFSATLRPPKNPLTAAVASTSSGWRSMTSGRTARTWDTTTSDKPCWALPTTSWTKIWVLSSWTWQWICMRKAWTSGSLSTWRKTENGLRPWILHNAVKGLQVWNDGLQENKWKKLLRFDLSWRLALKISFYWSVTPSKDPWINRWPSSTGYASFDSKIIASRDRKSAEIFHWFSPPFSSDTLIPLFMFFGIPNKVRLGFWNTRGLFEDLTICIFLLLYE